MKYLCFTSVFKLQAARFNLPASDEHCVHLTFDLWTHLSELFKGELVAGLGQLLDNLSDPVARQWQVRHPEKLRELVLADVSVVVDICGGCEGQRSNRRNTDSDTQHTAEPVSPSATGSWIFHFLVKSQKRLRRTISFRAANFRFPSF